jgi:ribosome-interacting GTPase 1
MNLVEAIYKLNPTVVTIRGDVAYDANEQVVAYDLAAAESLVTANAYAELRASAYPSIQDQLDMQYWDSVNGTTTWKDAIATVKTENPKP